jgi:hypothetical protein
MNILNIALPVQAFMPVAESFAGNAIGIARPLFGFGAFAALLLVFKPLLLGLLRAALLAVKPRQTLEQRSSLQRMRSVLMLNSMARELDATSPALAAELRSIARRG